MSTRKPGSHSDQPATGEVPTVALCELLANPVAYDMKIVRVKAILVVNHGDRSLYDPSCIPREPIIGVEPDPFLHYESRAGVPEQFYHLLRPENEIREGSARVIIVGRFEGPNFAKDGRKSRFQHRFVVMQVEKAESVIEGAAQSLRQSSIK